ncbi:nuclear transport factor 2 family protein [Aquabacterium humicola]|uniref:nuclear transport factor 2 family protein n=1 Tax=Aquabacterium humicola TaxID=3237377 RepID=UPI00254319F4|nr:DUF4440 domain-containing protein [Rubrivivax pictus]
MQSLVQQLQALEVELHHPGVRCSRERLEQLLHPDFVEVGRSGASYTRETIVSYLTTSESSPTVESSNFEATLLAPGAALLTYRSAHRSSSGFLSLHALRSSLWLNVEGRWQLRYHQGTPAATTW